MRFRLELTRVFEGSNSVTYSFTVSLVCVKLTLSISEEDLGADFVIEKESFIASRNSL